MKSIKQGRKYKGSPISLGAVCDLERRPRPVRLSGLTEIAHRTFGGTIDSGDVKCTWKMTLHSNGFWAVQSTFKSSGDVAGDHFQLALLLDQAQGVGVELSGRVGAGDTVTMDQRGSDPRIRDEWTSITQVRVRLQAQWDVGEIVGVVLIGLLTFGAVVFFADGTKKGVRRCGEQTLDDHTPCIEVYRIEEA